MAQHFQVFMTSYGYIAIFIFLFFGIVGIPSPEESMMIFVGIAASHGTFNVFPALLAALLGSLSGMITAYIIGYTIGNPILYKLGKFMGNPEKKWDKAAATFKRHASWSIAAGFFIPGVRQLNPYMAGISRLKLPVFLSSCLAGALTWTTSFILIGYFIGQKIEKFFRLTPTHVGIGLALVLVIFATVFTIQFFLFKRRPN